MSSMTTPVDSSSEKMVSYMLITEIYLPKDGIEVIDIEPMHVKLCLAAVGDLCVESEIDDYDVEGTAAVGPLTVKPFLYRPEDSKEYISLSIVERQTDRKLIELHGIVQVGQLEVSTLTGGKLYVNYQVYQGIHSQSVELRDNIEGQDTFLAGVTMTLLGDTEETMTAAALIQRIHVSQNKYPRTFMCVYPNIGDPKPEILSLTHDDTETQEIGKMLRDVSESVKDENGDDVVVTSIPHDLNMGSFKSTSSDIGVHSAVYYGLHKGETSYGYSVYLPTHLRQQEIQESQLGGLDLSEIPILRG